MKTDELNCPICTEKYNHDIRAPRILPLCGHTICTECLKDILNHSAEPKCPLDVGKLPSNGQSLEPFPINFLAMQLIEGHHPVEKVLCPNHNEKLRLICLTDGAKICDDCMFYGEHKGHDIKPMKKIRAEAHARKGCWLDALGNVNKAHQNLKENLSVCEKELYQTIKAQFKQIHELLILKENSFLFEVEALLKMQGDYVGEVSGFNSALQVSIQNKIEALAGISMKLDLPPDFLYLLEEDISKTNKDTVKSLEALAEKIEFKELTLIKSSFLEPISKLKDSVSDIKGPFHSLQKQLSGFELPIETDDGGILGNYISQKTLSVSSIFEVSIQGSCLEVVAKKGERKTITLEKAQWDKISNVTLVFEQYNLKDEDSCVLRYIWKNLEKLNKLSVKFLPEGAKDTVLLELLPLIFWRAKEIEEIDMDFAKCNLTSQSIVPLCNLFISQMSKLTSFGLDLSFTRISKRTVECFIRNNLGSLKNLVTFKLFLRDVSLGDEVVSQLFTPMPNVKNYQLSLGHTKITDKALEMFTRNTLPTMKTLENLELYLWKNEITESSLLALSENIPEKVKVIKLDLEDLDVSDEFLKEFTKEEKIHSTNLQEFEVNTKGTKISSSGMEILEEFKTKLKNQQKEETNLRLSFMEVNYC